MSYQDNMILDEIGENDAEMHKDAIKNAKRYRFKSKQEAARFIGYVLDKTMLWCGVMVVPGMDPKMVDRQLAVQNVIVEPRNKYKGENIWRKGLYIYKDDVIAAFISLPRFGSPGSKLALDQHPAWWVITNGKV